MPAPILRIEIKGLEELKKKLTGSRLLSGPMRKGMERIGQAGELIAKREVPVDTGTLRRGQTHQVDKKDPPEFVHIGSDLQYARFVHGDFDERKRRTRPHFPSASALEGWARRHGVPLWPLLKGIAKRGTPFNPYLTRTMVKLRGTVRSTMSKVGKDVERLWSR